MLFNVILIIMAVYLMVLPFILLKFIKFGMKIAVSETEKVASEPTFTIPKKKHTPKVPKEMQKTLDIMENINNFDGTGIGQKEIKE